MLVTIEGGFNPRLKSVSSSADWLKVEDVGPTEMEEFTDPETGFKWLSGGSYPLLRLTYDSFDDRQNYEALLTSFDEPFAAVNALLKVIQDKGEEFKAIK